MADLRLQIMMEAVDRITAPFRRASQSTDQLRAAARGAAGEVRKLEQASASIDAFNRLQERAKANARALEQAKAAATGAELLARIKQLHGTQEEATKAAAAFAKAQRQVEKLSDVGRRCSLEMEELRQGLGQAGINTDDLAGAQADLARRLEEARGAATRQSAALDQARARMDALNQARRRLSAAEEAAGRMAGHGAAAMAGGGGILAAALPAIGRAEDGQYQGAAYGLTAGQSGAALEAVKAKVAAISEVVNQSSAAMMQVQADLVGKGLDPDVALASLETIGKAITGTGASFEDMGNLSFSTLDNLKVPVAELSQALDIMAKAGDSGGFELKDMAKSFPQLTASAYSLGMVGTKAVGSLAAALQIATKGAADPSEAANNLANFLKAFSGQEAVKNFQKKGIDINKALQQGIKDGKDPLEVMMQQVGKAVGADLEKEMSDAVASGLDPKEAAERVGGRFKLSEIFGDAQVQNFLAPMLANMPLYRKIRDEALAGAGTVDGKFATMMDTFKVIRQGLGVSFDNMLGGIGETMLPTLADLATSLRGVVQGITAFTAAHPRMAQWLAIGTIAVGGLITAAGALGLAIASIRIPLSMLNIAMMTNPILLIIAAIAAGAILIYQNWSTVGPFFIGAIKGFQTALAPVQQAITSAFGPMVSVFKEVAARLSLAYDLSDSLGVSFSNLSQIGEMCGYVIGMALQGVLMPITLVAEAIGGILSLLGIAGPELANVATADAVAKARAIPVVATAPAVATQAANSPTARAAAVPSSAGTTNTTTITVHGAPGQSEAEIAKQVKAELDRRDRQQQTAARSRMYDGEK